jgi:hypothetical protein
MLLYGLDLFLAFSLRMLVYRLTIETTPTQAKTLDSSFRIA